MNEEKQQMCLTVCLLGPAPALLLGPPPDADHVVTGHGHHVLVVKTTRHLVLDNGIRTSLSDNS